MIKGEPQKNKPLPIFKYTQFMNGIDCQDQMNTYYPCERKTLCWYKKFGLWQYPNIIQLCLLNAHSLYNKYFGKKLSLYDFCLSVIEYLLEMTRDRNSTHFKKVCEQLHCPKRITEENNKGETIRKQCKYCHKQKIWKMTMFYCNMCYDKPCISPGECFTEFHK